MQINSYPKISIVIPSYNQGQYIEQTLLSVIGQQYPNLEIIVIDGGSDDQTVEVVKKYSQAITHFISEPDNGQGDAINKGFRLATGDIYCWLNSDDMYLPGILHKVAQVLNDYSEPNLVYGSGLYMYEGQSIANAYLPIDFDVDKLKQFDYILQPSTFWTRILWEKVGELNNSYYYVLDWEWFIRASDFCKFIPVKDYFSIVRHHENHKTGTGGNKRRNEIVKIIENYGTENWISVYSDVLKKSSFLKSGRNLLDKLNLSRCNFILCPDLCLKYGVYPVHRACSMLFAR